jgi:osmotically-inducible protein OsmY
MVSPLTSMTDRIAEAIQSDARTKGAVIDVVCDRGVVTLTGTTKSEAIRQLAEEIAKSQEGVITVINEIRVV